MSEMVSNSADSLLNKQRRHWRKCGHSARRNDSARIPARHAVRVRRPPTRSYESPLIGIGYVLQAIILRFMKADAGTDVANRVEQSRQRDDRETVDGGRAGQGSRSRRLTSESHAPRRW